MTEQDLFVLILIRENFLKGHWSFRAGDEVAVAQYLLRDPWVYQDVFWALHLSTQEVQRMRPEDLVQAIQDSYWKRHARAVVYLFRIAPPADCTLAESTGSAPGGSSCR